MKPLLFYQIKGRFMNIGDSWDKLAPEKENAIDFAHENINAEPSKRVDGSKYSLEYCLAHSGERINDRYRWGEVEPIDGDIAAMVAAQKNKCPVVLYRGVCRGVFNLMRKNAGKIAGIDLLEKSFLQTSLVKGCESNSKYHLRIYVPTGIPMVYLGNVNDEQFFYEVDIQHGSQLKIISMDEKYINCRLIGTN